jgi:hypothetical protein
MVNMTRHQRSRAVPPNVRLSLGETPGLELRLSRASFLKTGAVAALGGSGFINAAERAVESPVRSIISIVLAGGLSQLDSFDPKPEARVEVRGELKAIQTSTPSVFFSELVPRLASRSHEIAVLRGMSHGFGVHEAGESFMMTGVRGFQKDTPYLGAIVSCFSPGRFSLPAYAAIPSLPPNAGELGGRHEPLNVFGDTGRLLKQAPSPDDVSAVSAFGKRMEVLKSLNSSAMRSQELQERSQAYESAVNRIGSRPLRDLLDLTEPEDKDLSAYGKSEAGRYLLIARRLVELGVRFVTVRLPGWDTHTGNSATLRSLLPPLDQAVAQLLDDLKDRALLSGTLVSVVTEFGRSSVINGSGGRDHSTTAYSVLLAGGRVQGGRILGMTNAESSDVVEGRCAPCDLAMTVLQEIGISASTLSVPPSGRVLLPEGRVLEELF